MSFICVTRPHAYTDVLHRHLPMALTTGLVLLLARIAPSGLLSSIHCPFHELTGCPCPLCGLTRTFRAMAAGNWNFAVYNSPLGVILYILTGVVLAWNLTGLLAGVEIAPAASLRRFLYSPLIIGLGIALVTANWFYRIILGLQ